MIPKNKKILAITLALFLSIFINSYSYAQTPTEQISPEITTEPTEKIEPTGQVLNVIFKIPGIGAAGENTNPRNTTRNLIIYFYNPSINAEDPSVKPLYTFPAAAEFDSEPASPTFGSFINPNIDLMNKVPDGSYQIAIKADSALAKLIKDDPKDIAGKIFQVKNSYPSPLELNAGEIIIGDIFPIPNGNNIMDINDYNQLVSCFGAKAEGSQCSNYNYPDLNNDGVIDGIDYNLMFGSFKTLLTLGKPVPSIIIPKPTTKPTAKPTIKPTSAKTPTPTASSEEAVVKSSNNSSFIFPLIAIIILAGLTLVIILKRKRVLDFYSNLSHKNSKRVEATAPIEKTDEIIADQEIDKDFFVKKQTEDIENKRIVLSLTDDSGPTLGYYSGEKVEDGFANVKGTLKQDGNKIFIEVKQITPVAETPPA